jgi:hypothetical protein
VINGLRILLLLFTENLAMASFTSYRLQKKIEPVDKYCKNWNLKYKLKTPKIMALKKGGK